MLAFDWLGLPGLILFGGAAIIAALVIWLKFAKDVRGWLRPSPPDVLIVWGPNGPGAHLSQRPLDERPEKLPYWTKIEPWYEIENADPTTNVYHLATGAERGGIVHSFEIGEVPILKAGDDVYVNGRIPADKFSNFLDITTATSPQLEFSYWVTLRDSNGRWWRGVQTPPEQVPTWSRTSAPR